MFRVTPLAAKTAFLFDLDGTLVESNALHERVFRDVLLDYAPQFLHGFDYEALKGRPTAESFASLGVQPAALDHLVREKQQRYRAAVRGGELRLTPGAFETLESLRARLKRLFLVTGASGRSALAAVEATGIRGFLDGLITADDVSRGKPAPDGFRLCLERFAIAPGDAVGIEDSANGIGACRAAGVEAILVNNANLRGDLSFPSLVEFRLACIGEKGVANA